MLTIHRIKTADTLYYRFMEDLIVQSFPPEEYRRLTELQIFTDKKGDFHNNVVLDGDNMIGIITYWDFEDFCYVEHFAIHPKVRNNGYGSKVLDCICRKLSTPLVLEVEIPDNEIARRRIEFYKRNGFTLWDREYFQPPYRQGDSFLPMRIMAYGSLDMEKEFEKIRKCIYKDVYGADETVFLSIIGECRK